MRLLVFGLLALALGWSWLTLVRHIWMDWEEEKQRERIRRHANGEQICWARFHNR